MLHCCPVVQQSSTRNIVLCSHSGARIGARKFALAKRAKQKEVLNSDKWNANTQMHILIAPSPLPLHLPITAQYTGNLILILGFILLFLGMLKDRDRNP